MLDAGAGDWFAGAVREHGRAGALVDPWQPGTQLFGGALPERDDALFASFASELHGDLAVEEQVGDSQAGEFGDASAGVVERSEQDGVALPVPASYTQKLWMRVKRKAAYLPG